VGLVRFLTRHAVSLQITNKTQHWGPEGKEQPGKGGWIPAFAEMVVKVVKLISPPFSFRDGQKWLDKLRTYVLKYIFDRSCTLKTE
jgi:hypothetical protein